MATLPDNSVDAIVTDPPYGLGFMGKDWDDLPPGLPWAVECLRVLKPGGHLLAFGGTRTWHRLAVAVEDAGFEVRDSIAWLYGSGFPKSLDVSKAIDKVRSEDLEPAAAVARFLVDELEKRGLTRRDVCEHFGAENIAQQWATHWTTGAVKPRVPRVEQWAELRRWLDLPDTMDAEVWRLNGNKGKPGEGWTSREIVGQYNAPDPRLQGWAEMQGNQRGTAKEKRGTATTPAAQQWAGWGTALKPAFEPIVVARKPLDEGTVAANVLEWGTGALNVDGCRVNPGTAVPGGGGGPASARSAGILGEAVPGNLTEPHAAGRWPANVLLDGDAAAELDEQSGTLKSGDLKPYTAKAGDRVYAHGLDSGDRVKDYTKPGDSGGASRFFPTFRYQAKAPTRERPKVGSVAHPTVKPLALMEWLVRLATPPGGVVLEPFAGSGTTVEACLVEGLRCIAIEREADYLPLIEARIARQRRPDVPNASEALALFDFEEPA